MHSTAESFLLFRVGGRRCGVPLAHVAETLRPLPVEPLADTPAFVLGLAVIRGAPIPVLDAAALLAGEGSSPARFVVLRTPPRRVALAVGEVLGVQTLDGSALTGLPPLLGEVGRELIAALGTADGELLLVLDTMRLLPDAVWSRLTAGEAA